MLIFASAPMLCIYLLLGRAYGFEHLAAASLLTAAALSFFTISVLLMIMWGPRRRLCRPPLKFAWHFLRNSYMSPARRVTERFRAADFFATSRWFEFHARRGTSIGPDPPHGQSV